MPDPQPDLVAQALKRAPLTNAARAEAWDAYYQSESPDAFGEKLKAIAMPTPVKAYLFDLKAGKPSAPPWTMNHPQIAEAVKQGLNALPGIGAIVGGVAATPETMGTGTIAGAALGAGAGRGARDLATEALGLEPTTSPIEKAGKIALDTAITAATPGIVVGAKTPIATAREIGQQTPELVQKWLYPPILKEWLKAVPVKNAAAILERPAWQTWARTPEQAAEKLHITGEEMSRGLTLIKGGKSPAEAIQIILKGRE